MTSQGVNTQWTSPLLAHADRILCVGSTGQQQKHRLTTLSALLGDPNLPPSQDLILCHGQDWGQDWEPEPRTAGWLLARPCSPPLRP
jgi:hypothetical protein